MMGLIGHHLHKKVCKVKFAEGDADISIVREAVEISQHFGTVFVAEDTYLLILLLYHITDNGFTLHFRKLGEPLCRNLLFFHAYTGCASTSYIYGVGKTSAFKELLKSGGLKEAAQIFCILKKSLTEIDKLD
ncbi:hypothetical protein PR048_010219 [Dryococelus australis]|uniref:Uncharacterized protein n=1 Tax=Dryococelus australis TaxID=614101 RepID=A0ABQ9I381_9NEOP|nr:hypothetical protein PR048_010219 [Dryococelus australis]